MSKVLKFATVIALVAASASASAWWGGNGPWRNWGGPNFGGPGYGAPAYGPGYGGYRAPYGGGYRAPYGAPAYGAPFPGQRAPYANLAPRQNPMPGMTGPKSCGPQ